MQFAVARLTSKNNNDPLEKVLKGIKSSFEVFLLNIIRSWLTGPTEASTDPDNRKQILLLSHNMMLEGIEVTKAGTPDQEGDVLGTM